MATIGFALITAGLVVGLGALLALHLWPTGLSPIRDPVSRYGISRYRTGYRIQTLAYAGAGLGATLGLAALPASSALPVALCAIYTAARASISWFPMDAPGAPRTSTGRRHELLAIAAFLSLAIAAAALPRTLQRGDADPTLAATSGALAVLMFIALFAMSLDRRIGSRHFGLLERAFYLAMTAWLVTVGVFLTAGGR